MSGHFQHVLCICVVITGLRIVQGAWVSCLLAHASRVQSSHNMVVLVYLHLAIPSEGCL